jgi:hypothetical protein
MPENQKGRIMSKQLKDEPAEHTQRSSFFDEPKDLATLASEQGVKPFNFDEFMSHPALFPDSESADDFIAAIREWRREGKADKE